MRNSQSGSLVASQYSKIRLVYGSLDDHQKLEEEAREADIVLSMWTLGSKQAKLEVRKS